MIIRIEATVSELIGQFVCGAENPIACANEIEHALDEAFPDDKYVQQTVEMLARYRPEGGQFLFDTAAITPRLIETLQYLHAMARGQES